jgi:hypothetical protein
MDSRSIERNVHIIIIKLFYCCIIIPGSRGALWVMLLEKNAECAKRGDELAEANRNFAKAYIDVGEAREKIELLEALKRKLEQHNFELFSKIKFLGQRQMIEWIGNNVLKGPNGEAVLFNARAGIYISHLQILDYALMTRIHHHTHREQ